MPDPFATTRGQEQEGDERPQDGDRSRASQEENQKIHNDQLRETLTTRGRAITASQQSVIKGYANERNTFGNPTGTKDGNYWNGIYNPSDNDEWTYGNADGTRSMRSMPHYNWNGGDGVDEESQICKRLGRVPPSSDVPLTPLNTGNAFSSRLYGDNPTVEASPEKVAEYLIDYNLDDKASILAMRLSNGTNLSDAAEVFLYKHLHDIETIDELLVVGDLKKFLKDNYRFTGKIATKDLVLMQTELKRIWLQAKENLIDFHKAATLDPEPSLVMMAAAMNSRSEREMKLTHAFCLRYCGVTYESVLEGALDRAAHRGDELLTLTKDQKIDLTKEQKDAFRKRANGFNVEDEAAAIKKAFGELESIQKWGERLSWGGAGAFGLFQGGVLQQTGEKNTLFSGVVNTGLAAFMGKVIVGEGYAFLKVAGPHHDLLMSTAGHTSEQWAAMEPHLVAGGEGLRSEKTLVEGTEDYQNQQNAAQLVAGAAVLEMSERLAASGLISDEALGVIGGLRENVANDKGEVVGVQHRMTSEQGLKLLNAISLNAEVQQAVPDISILIAGGLTNSELVQIQRGLATKPELAPYAELITTVEAQRRIAGSVVSANFSTSGLTGLAQVGSRSDGTLSLKHADAIAFHIISQLDDTENNLEAQSNAMLVQQFFNRVTEAHQIKETDKPAREYIIEKIESELNKKKEAIEANNEVQITEAKEAQNYDDALKKYEEEKVAAKESGEAFTGTPPQLEVKLERVPSEKFNVWIANRIGTTEDTVKSTRSSAFDADRTGNALAGIVSRHRVAYSGDLDPQERVRQMAQIQDASLALLGNVNDAGSANPLDRVSLTQSQVTDVVQRASVVLERRVDFSSDVERLVKPRGFNAPNINQPADLIRSQILSSYRGRDMNLDTLLPEDLFRTSYSDLNQQRMGSYLTQNADRNFTRMSAVEQEQHIQLRNLERVSSRQTVDSTDRLGQILETGNRAQIEQHIIEQLDGESPAELLRLIRSQFAARAGSADNALERFITERPGIIHGIESAGDLHRLLSPSGSTNLEGFNAWFDKNREDVALSYLAYVEFFVSRIEDKDAAHSVRAQLISSTIQAMQSKNKEGFTVFPEAKKTFSLTRTIYADKSEEEVLHQMQALGAPRDMLYSVEYELDTFLDRLEFEQERLENELGDVDKAGAILLQAQFLHRQQALVADLLNARKGGKGVSIKALAVNSAKRLMVLEDSGLDSDFQQAITAYNNLYKPLYTNDFNADMEQILKALIEGQNDPTISDAEKALLQSASERLDPLL